MSDSDAAQNRNKRDWDEQSQAEQSQDEQSQAERGRRERYRTGSEQPWDPEDLAVAQGHDPTPENIERARRQLEEQGPAAIERTVP